MFLVPVLPREEEEPVLDRPPAEDEEEPHCCLG